ncbi:DUF6509 family protein [Paenibacillus sacheonensis]|uniref:Pullulanase n=1 Tax=Paenibacillus sacheonensis TaxID=742054 RepID=A0A7X5BXA6_9BACL|nr:DUF6509 family protein [Paenibacillus sacheonensis]MBM7563266.1 hypothetical protein [Paenibacillus sacheonensis]NBC68176.1 pullulanase [Paenibacillus sacheonensis]
MVEIEAYEVEKVKDPFGILTGERYEFKLEIEVAEDDELYVEGGLYIRVIYRVDGEDGKIVRYALHERINDKFVDAELEDEEERMLESFCGEHFSEAEE